MRVLTVTATFALLILGVYPNRGLGQEKTSIPEKRGTQKTGSEANLNALHDDRATHKAASEASQPRIGSRRTRRGSMRRRHSRPVRLSSSIRPVALVSSSPDYLSGEASVTVKGNENPIVRLGLARSGVTLVEFPASDRFFALHPGNSDMVTIDESPTKQNDHFFVFRAGSNFVRPNSRASTEPSASIIAQMRSGMVVTFLIYPVLELSQMAHRVVILYDRADVVAARRAAGLAVNLDENRPLQQEHSIRIAEDSDSAGIPGRSPGADNDNPRPRTAAVGPVGSVVGNSNGAVKPISAGKADRSGPKKGAESADDLEAEARKALKLAITSTKLKNWTHAVHGLSLATSPPRELSGKDGSNIVIVGVNNTLPEPLRLVPGQPDLSVETRDEQGKKALLVERIKPLHTESSGIGDSIPAESTLYYAIVYRRPVLGVRQHLRVTVGQINAADEPASVDIATSSR